MSNFKGVIYTGLYGFDSHLQGVYLGFCRDVYKSYAGLCGLYIHAYRGMEQKHGNYSKAVRDQEPRCLTSVFEGLVGNEGMGNNMETTIISLRMIWGLLLGYVAPFPTSNPKPRTP